MIRDAIVNGKDVQTARWYAERKGRSRGYAARQEITGADGGEIAVRQKLEVTVQYVDAAPQDEEPVT